MRTSASTKLTAINFTLLITLMIYELSASVLNLEYQHRGNRNEGVKPKPVSGYDVELISARVDYTEKLDQIPERLKLKFYLDRPSEVYLTVRELDYIHYYWMDKVQPSKPWRPGFDNVFDWPSRDVLQQLRGIEMYDLGIVARLDRPEPSKLERVAPVLFYAAQPPTTIKGYLFTFKASSDARLSYAIYKQGMADPVFTESIPRQSGGRPFTVRWDSSQVAEGTYSVMLKGYSLETNDPIDQTVAFYHQPLVR
jgi:hypothetical protein